MHASILFWVGCWNLVSPVDKFKPASETTGTEEASSASASASQPGVVFVAAPPATNLTAGDLAALAGGGGRHRGRRQAGVSTTTFTIGLYTDDACTQSMGNEKTIDTLEDCTSIGQAAGKSAISKAVCKPRSVHFILWKNRLCKGPGQCRTAT